MNIQTLIAAVVLNSGRTISDESGEDLLLFQAMPFSEIGEILGMSRSAVRHRIQRFKQKYNITTDMVHFDDNEWNRNTLAFFEDVDFEASAGMIAGDVCHYFSGESSIYLGEELNEYAHFDMNGDLVEIVEVEDETPASRVDYHKHVQETIENANKELEERLSQAEKELSVIMSSRKEWTEEEWKVVIDNMVELTGKQYNLTPVQQPLKYLLTPSVLVVVRDEVPLSIDRSHKHFAKIEAALKAEKWKEVLDLIDMKTAIQKYSNGRVVVDEGIVLLDGQEVSGKLSDRLMDALYDDDRTSLQRLSNFMMKCDENPDYNVVSRIYDFIQHNDLEIDLDGDILGYKIVRGDYFDLFSGTMDNSPGQVVKMKRNQVNSDDSVTCSHGLHIAASHYLPHYGSLVHGNKIVLCKTDPKNIVSIPNDYKNSKVRACEYLVLRDVTENFHGLFGMEEEWDDEEGELDYDDF